MRYPPRLLCACLACGSQWLRQLAQLILQERQQRPGQLAIARRINFRLRDDFPHHRIKVAMDEIALRGMQRGDGLGVGGVGVFLRKSGTAGTPA
jgi:hypothetical protein